MDAYDLTRLDPNTFEQLVNMLALQVLGAGATGFGPGADGGRDGWFQGEAPYPSTRTRWKGTWYLQSKFHKPHLSANSQKWLLNEITAEIQQFQRGRQRHWPDNWIIATNIDPTGKPETGSFDAAKRLVSAANSDLSKRFHIWGGSKILSLLAAHSNVANYYAEFLTPGHVISGLYKSIVSQNASFEDVVRDLCVTAFDDYQYTKLDQAGSDADNRPGIQKLYTDLPYAAPNSGNEGMVAIDLARTSALRHNTQLTLPPGETWDRWAQEPSRSRTWFIKGGPGQGKSTSTQYLAQVQRAAILLGADGPPITPSQRQVAEEVRDRALADDIWPLAPRLPVTVELRDFAQWFGSRSTTDSCRMLVYIVQKISKSIGPDVAIGTFKSSLSIGRWLFVFDGLDEVPGDVKDEVANEVRFFTENVLVGLNTDALIISTSRPQGYSGQFETMTRTIVELSKLSPDQALKCATPVLQIGRSQVEGDASIAILREALENSAVREIMTSPLQAHIMAVVVRGGGKPPERKWQLFQNFYEVIRGREASRTLPNPKLAHILLRGDKLIKSLHARLGFELHARAETSTGATASLSKIEFRKIVETVVGQLQDDDVEGTVSVVMEATTDRLVLVNTPESGEFVRFDIRPLQEFFAAEYLCEVGINSDLKDRLFLMCRDSHWREVMHFYMSALVENDRKSEMAIVVEVLGEVNTGILNESSRALSLRLALGSLQAARLLSEGVLEQDKRVRLMFRAALEPISGCTDATQLMHGPVPPHSRSWFIDVLMASTREKTEAECFGAVALLCTLLNEDDPQVDDLRRFILTMTGDARAILLQVLGGRYELWGGESAPSWIQGIVVAMLCDPKWLELGDDYWLAPAIVSVGGVFNPAVGVRLGWSEELSLAIPLILSENRFRLRKPIKQTSSSPIYGIANIRTFSSNLPVIVKNWPDDIWRELKGKGGLFEGAYLVLRHYATGLTSDLSALLAWINADLRRLAPLGHILGGFIDSNIGRESIGEPVTETIIRKSHVGDSRQVEITSESGNSDWALAMKERGDIISDIILYEDHDEGVTDIRKFVSTPRGIESVRDFISSGNMDDNLGHLLEFLQDAGADNPEVHHAIAKRASHSEPTWPAVFRAAHFTITLPDDASMLPYVAANVVFDFLQQISQLSGIIGRIYPKSESPSVYKYGLGYEDLCAIVRKLKEGSHDYLAGLLLSALHTDKGDDELPSLLRVFKAMNPTSPDWSKAGLLIALSEGVMSANPEHWNMAAVIIEDNRHNYRFRRVVEPLLKRWREQTASPVQSSLSTMHWHS